MFPNQLKKHYYSTQIRYGRESSHKDKASVFNLAKSLGYKIETVWYFDPKDQKSKDKAEESASDYAKEWSIKTGLSILPFLTFR